MTATTNHNRPRPVRDFLDTAGQCLQIILGSCELAAADALTTEAAMTKVYAAAQRLKDARAALVRTIRARMVTRTERHAVKQYLAELRDQVKAEVTPCLDESPRRSRRLA